MNLGLYLNTKKENYCNRGVFVKKTQKAPKETIKLAEKYLKEV